MADLRLSIDQFVALEVWVERFAKGDTPAQVHAARQRAFSLLTGVDAPLPATSEERMAMADATVDGVDTRRRIGPKAKKATPHPEDNSDLA